MESITSAETVEQTKPKIKAASVPIYPLPTSEVAILKVQISAPSYLFSLKENEAPPFVRPGKEARPKLLIGTIVTEDDVVAMVAAAAIDKISGLKRFIGNFLVDNNVTVAYNLTEKMFLTNLITETTEYAARRDFGASKMACLLTIYLSSHLYFKWYYWQPPKAVWLYFKELMIRHTIEDSPDGEEVFEPEECYDIATHFHTVYLTNLPLVHILTFGSHRLKLSWPFK